MIEAEAIYVQVLETDPHQPDALHLLGTLRTQTGRAATGVELLQRAVQLRPGVGDFHSNLGIAHETLGQFDEAIAAFTEAARLKPENASIQYNLGRSLSLRGRFDEALVAFDRAVELPHDHLDVHFQIGGVQLARRNVGEALAAFDEAIRRKPDHAKAHGQRANALNHAGRCEEALAAFRLCAELQPNDAIARNNYAASLQFHGQVAAAIDEYRESLRLAPEFAMARSNLLLALNYVPDADPAEVFREHLRFAEIHERTAPPPRATVRDPSRRLRIGYVSPDLRAHPLVRYLEPVLEHHDRERFEIVCYAHVHAPDAVTARLKTLVSRWHSIHGKSADEVVDLIRADGIDLLVDLAGHTANNRLDVFMRRPAPAQATWIGYPNTTGLKSIDYQITDAIMHPPGEPVLDSERLVRLPGALVCFAPPTDAPAVSPLPAASSGRITFGSLHTLTKLNDRVFDLWAEVLRAVPGSRLLMFRDTLVGAARDGVARRFAERGIGADRLDLRAAGIRDRGAAYLSVYGEIDATLDLFPYAGGTTTCESLWMGVPVLTLAGNRPAGRGSATLLANAGLADWITSSPAAFVERACRIDLDALAVVRAGMRERLSATLCDAASFTRRLEDAYLAMIDDRARATP